MSPTPWPMDRLMHAAGLDGLFGSAALCGTTTDTTGSLALTDIPTLVTCHICRDLTATPSEETP